MKHHASWLLVGLCLIASLLPLHAAEEVKVVVVANWENGADMGDAPGEYQDWVEREHLDQTVAVRGAAGAVRRNAQGLYGLVLRRGASDLVAFILDPRFDFRHTYWLFTGISGVDPNAASVGSVAWARWVIDGDRAREIDDREIPAGWPWGLFAIGASRPGQLPDNPNHYGSVTDVAELSQALPLNAGLTHWAFQLSRHVPLADDPVIAARRRAWRGYPLAQQAPRVLEGETLGAIRYWHGAGRNRWAEDWVRMWTRGQGRFVMTNEESQTYQRIMLALAQQGLVDSQRVMVLRSASNFSLAPPGASDIASVGDEAPGQRLAFDNNQRAGSVVLHQLLAHWSRYRLQIPSTAPVATSQQAPSSPAR